jgi:hypothetical protein
LHWNLDVIFREDNQAKRNQTAIENVNLIAKSVNTMRDQEKTFLKYKSRKCLKGFADNTYRELIWKV